MFRGIVWARGEGSLYSRLRELEAIQWWPADRLLRRQDERLAEVLRYAAAHSPYYRDRLGPFGPFTADGIRARLRDLPFITKTDVQRDQEAMVALPKLRRVTRKTTGGSTGQAVTLVKDRHATAAEMAASWLGYGWFGIRMGDRNARFWGSPSTLRRRLRFAAADVAMHRIRFSAFAFDEGDLERYWRDCVRFGPQWFYGYVSMLEAFAQFVARRGLPGRSLGLKAIVTTAEVLTSPQRTLLEETFGARVQNEYGCGEVGPIAYECERGSLHLMTDSQLVEILTADGRPAAEGETGEIVVTDLNNRAMPLVRYRLGDLAVPAAACSCGRSLPALMRVWGRAYDFVEAADGRRYHGEFFMYVFEDLRGRGLGVEQFQVAQRAQDALEVRVTGVGPAVPNRIESAIQATFRERLPGMQVTVRAVESIPRQSSGKLRVIANERPGGGADQGPAGSR